MRGIAVPFAAQGDALRIPGDDLVPQAHRAGVRNEGFDDAATDHGASLCGWRAISRPSTKFDTTPSVTVVPIARNTGIDDRPSNANTSSVIALHTSSACSVRSC